MGEEGFGIGGVLDHGTYEEDGPVTWEILASPREIRFYGEPVIHLQNWRVCRRTCWSPIQLAEQASAPLR